MKSKTEEKSVEPKKIKTYAYWMAVCGSVLLVVVQILAIFKIYIETKVISDIVSSVLGALVVAGILIGPVKTNDEKTDEKDLDEDDEL